MTPELPPRWTVSAILAERAKLLMPFGFTERQARFLALVLQHTGVFVERQYCAFAGITHGQKAHNFVQRLIDHEYAVPIPVGPAHRGRIIRVRHRALYEAIHLPHSRLRKPAPLGRWIERLMVLDAILADQDFTWLGTAGDKRTYMRLCLGDNIRADELPHLTFRSPRGKTTRYFPDRLPLGVEPEQREHVFMYLVTKTSPVDFRMFLARHAELLISLRRWTIRLVIPRHLRRAGPLYINTVRQECATPLTPGQATDLAWWFRVRQTGAERFKGEDLEQYGNAKRQFRAPRFRALYRRWKADGDSAIRVAQSSILRDKWQRGEARVQCVELAHQYLHLTHLVGRGRDAGGS
jgi:hypothetical protein